MTMEKKILQPIQFDEVADIYDDYVRTDFDIPFWLSESKAVRGKVLELTCGTGRVSIPLLKAGVDLTCVDYAPGMLLKLQEKLEANHLSCPVIRQDIAELEVRTRFDLILIPFHSFSELIHEERRKSTLVRIRNHMTERGAFICTLQNPVVRTASMDGREHIVGDFQMESGDRLVVNSRLTFDPHTQLAEGEQLYDVFAPDGGSIGHRSLAIRFYLFYRSQFESLAEELGFDVDTLYGDYDRKSFDEDSSPFMIWKLRKSGG